MLIALYTRQHHAARVVQRSWRRAIADPLFFMCRRRLLREFVEAQEEKEAEHDEKKFDGRPA